MNPKSIIISRTDSIGDVVLTLPMCGVIKSFYPDCKIFFLGRAYTQSIIERCAYVDQYINWDEMKEKSPATQLEILKQTGADTIIHVFPRKEILWLGKRAGIPIRIATGRRLNTITKCNKLVFFTRKGSPLHEAQLNLKLLRPIGIDKEYLLEELGKLYGFTRTDITAEKKVKDFLKGFSAGKKKVVLHPLSKGSAAEWSLENYQKLTELLPKDKFEIFVTGTKDEGEKIKAQSPIQGVHVYDVTGKFSLAELIEFINGCDALVAASTGPLHIAAALGKKAIGLYSPKRPIHPGRWSPVGKDTHVLVAPAHPLKGEKLSIAPEKVAEEIDYS